MDTWIWQAFLHLVGHRRWLSDVGDVGLGTEYLDEVFLVVVDAALHDVHAWSQQSLERLDIQDCRLMDDYSRLIVRMLN